MGDIGVEQRSQPELGFGDSLARDADHLLGDVYPEDAVAGLGELLGPQTASATQVDYQGFLGPVVNQDRQYAGSGPKGELTEANIVDMSEVFSIKVGHILTLTPGVRRVASRGVASRTSIFLRASSLLFTRLRGRGLGSSLCSTSENMYMEDARGLGRWHHPYGGRVKGWKGKGVEGRKSFAGSLRESGGRCTG